MGRVIRPLSHVVAWGFVAVLGLVACQRQPSQILHAQSGDREAALSRANAEFLEIWLVKRSPQAAVGQYLSPLLADERFVPVDLSQTDDSSKFTAAWTQTPHPVPQAVVAARIAEYLSLVQRKFPQRPSMDTLLVPLRPQDLRDLDQGLSDILTSREARQLSPLPVLAYRVRTWRDLQWLASDNVGYRTVLPGLMQQNGLDVQGVLSRIRTDRLRAEPSLLHIIWVARPNAPTDWKVVGVDVPPTR